MNQTAHSEVMLMIHKFLKRNIDNYIYWSDRIIQIKLKLSQGYLTMIGTYAPVEGKEESLLLQIFTANFGKTNLIW
jgi:hypothetical protein